MKKILVIDDMIVSSEIIKIMLERLPQLEIDSADCVEQGLSLIYKNNYDLIITDIYMPGLTGIELVNKLKQDDNYKNIPIIVMSNSDYPEEKQAAKESGAIGFLSKPLVKDEFNELFDFYVKFFD